MEWSDVKDSENAVFITVSEITANDNFSQEEKLATQAVCEAIIAAGIRISWTMQQIYNRSQGSGD